MRIANMIEETQKRSGEKDKAHFRKRQLRAKLDFSIKHRTVHGLCGSASLPANHTMYDGARRLFAAGRAFLAYGCLSSAQLMQHQNRQGEVNGR